MRKLLIFIILLAGLIGYGQTSVPDYALKPLVFADFIAGFDDSQILYVDCNYAGSFEAGNPAAPYTTIQAAIDVAVSGDLILVSACAYEEHLTFTEDSVTLMGIGGASLNATIVSGAGIDVVDWTTIFGFYLTTNSGGAIVEINNDDNVRLYNNTFDIMNNDGTFGISVGASGSDSLYIGYNKFLAAVDDGCMWLQKTNTNVIIEYNHGQCSDSSSSYFFQTAGIDGGRINNNTGFGFKSFIFIHTVTSGTAGSYNVDIFENTGWENSYGIRLGHSSMTVNMDSINIFNNNMFRNTTGIGIINDAQVLSGSFIEAGNIYSDNKFNRVNAGTKPFLLANIDGGDYNTGGRYELNGVELGAMNNILWVDGDYAGGTVATGSFNSPYLTIQTAIAAASTGDIILVAPGTYTGHIANTVDDLKLIGMGGASQTTIALTPSGGTGVDMNAENMTIQGFTFTMSSGGFLIQLEGGEDSFKLIDCVLDTDGNPTIGLNIGASGCSNMLVENNTFISNTDNGAMWLDKNITNVLIKDNLFLGQDSAISYAIQTAGSVDGRFVGNVISGYGSGIFIHTVTSGSGGSFNNIVENNTIFNCGKAIRMGHSSQSVNQDSVFIFSNICFYNSFGIFISPDAQLFSETFSIIGNQLVLNTVNYRNENTAPAYLSNFIGADFTTLGKLNSATLNTGQGDNELYAMNQDVETTDAVTFATVNTGEGDNELFDMNQNVLTTSDVEFNIGTFDTLYANQMYESLWDVINISEFQNSIAQHGYWFDGDDDNIALDDRPWNGHTGSTISVDGWAYANDYTGNNFMFSFGGSTANAGMVLGDIGSVWQLTVSNGSSNNITNFTNYTTMLLNQWFHWCVTADLDGYKKLYINGAIVDSVDISALSGTFDDNTGNFFIGNSSSTWSGQQSQVRAWTKELTADEIEDLAQEGSILYKYQGADTDVQTIGTLVIGKEYIITLFVGGDDFVNVGGTNVTGTVFTATGTTPDTWTNSSQLDNPGCVGNWNQNGISTDTWYDASENGNDGTVSGAIVSNPIPHAVFDTLHSLVVNAGSDSRNVNGTYNYIADDGDAGYTTIDNTDEWSVNDFTTIALNAPTTITGTLDVTGAIYCTMGFADSSQVLDMSTGVYKRIDNDAGTLWTAGINKNMSIVGDSIQIPVDGNYSIHWDLSFMGANTDTYHIELAINTVGVEGFGEAQREMSVSKLGTSAGCTILALSALDWITLTIKNDANNNDATIAAGNICIKKLL